MINANAIRNNTMSYIFDYFWAFSHFHAYKLLSSLEENAIDRSSGMLGGGLGFSRITLFFKLKHLREKYIQN